MVPLLRAAHLQPTLAVTALVTALAVRAGRGGSSVWVALAILTGQLAVGWSNDWIDRDRDAAAGRRDKPIAAGDVPASLVGRAAVAAAVLCVGFSLANGWRAGVVHVGAVALALAYNARLKATVLSPVPYAVSFGSLPWFVTLGLPGHQGAPWWAGAGAALLGVGAHFVNTLPDQPADVALGVRGVPQRIGRTPSLLLGAAFLAAASVLLALAPGGATSAAAYAGLGAALLAVVAVVVLARAGRDRAAWTATIVAAGLAVALLVEQGARLA